jgi:hypothetical protein
MRNVRVFVLLFCLIAVACNGTTGDQLITFSAYASGAAGAAEPFTAGGFRIQLTAARMRIGAVYFDEGPPGTSFDGPVCTASGVYAAQVPGPVTVDLLSSEPQQFSVYGNGTADTALSWQVWLTDGDVNEVNVGHVVDLEGTATGADGKAISFGAIVTINSNRSQGSSNPAEPGQNPVCKARIVQIGGIDLPFFQGGALYITVDPRAWFTDLDEPIDFSAGQLPLASDANCLDADMDAPLSGTAYALSPETPPPGSQNCGGSGQPCCMTDAGGTTTLTCNGPLACTNEVCGPTYCIPNSSFLAGTDPGATAGQDFFTEVASGGPFSVRYGSPP